MKKLTKIFAMIAAVSLLMLMLSGCSGEQDKTKPAEPAPDVTVISVESPAGEPAAEPAQENGTQRQVGERFEGVIMMEGMEETVRYEHIRSDVVGFEMDYDYESFTRQSEAGRERFVSIYDNPAAPMNYLEVIYLDQSPDAVSASIGDELSKNYDIIREPFELDRAGVCERIDASATKDNRTPDMIEAVYIIPAGDGCLVAAAHYSFESAEGFGRRFHYIMDTFSVIACQGEKRLTDEQAISAIKRYCCIAKILCSHKTS